MRIAQHVDVNRPLAVAVPLGVALAIGLYSGRAGRDAPAYGVPHVRNDALERARVILDPELERPRDLGRNPADVAEIGSDDFVACRYQPSPATGTTPKFECALADGEIVKVKYGDNPEIPAEIAASRLLSALGFGADRMYLVRRVRCHGCPPHPFPLQRAADLLGGEGLFRKTLDYAKWSDFEWAAIERLYDAPPITSAGGKGWAWWELDGVDAGKGGASRAELDAFRLIAVFLAHWDNKSENQRLVCLSGEPDGRRCARPFAMIQDAGATFGPSKADLRGWRSAALWHDAGACTVSMRALPHRGGTFGEATISEAGRRMLAERLSRLGEPQVRDLVAAARFASFDDDEAEPGEPGEIDEWVATFLEKARAITDRPPCPR